MENYNTYAKYGPVGVCGYLQGEYGKCSSLDVGLISPPLLLLKETQNLLKGKTIMATFVVMMVESATNVAVIIFYLTVLDSNTPIPVSMVDVE